MDNVTERLRAVQHSDRLERGCPICGGYTPLIWTAETGWLLRCDICETIFGDKNRHFDREEALRFYTDKFQETRKFLKRVVALQGKEK